jgi:hypothetical protein
MVAGTAVAADRAVLGPRSRPRSKRDAGIICALVVVGVVLPLTVALWFHVFDIARNDDWAYRRVLWEFVQSGRFSFVGWGTMTLVGQVIWAAAFAGVFGLHGWVPGVAVACASAIGIGAAYLVARSVLPRVWAAVCVLLTLVFPGLLLNTTSFMTDMPTLAADMACLALGVVALRRRGRDRWLLLALSMAVGCFGFSIREFGLAAPIAVLVAMTAQDRPRWRAYAAYGAGVIAVCALLYVWANHVPGLQPEVIAIPRYSSLRTSLEGLGALYFTLSLVLSPLLPMALTRVWRLLSLRSAIFGLVVIALGAWLLNKGGIFAGNYLSQQGATGTAVLSGTRPDLFPEPVWRALEVIAVAAGIALALVVSAIVLPLLRTVVQGTTEGLVAAFVLLTGAVLVGYGVFVRASLFDRYLWPLTVASAIVLVANCLRLPQAIARSAGHRRAHGLTAWLVGTASVGLTAIIVLVTAAVTMNADAYDGARWQAGELAVKAGVIPSRVDAGFEWVGDHASELAISGRSVAGAPAYETWYDKMFPGFRECAFVSGSPWTAPALTLLRTTTYDELGFAVPERLYIYLVKDPGCPSGPK